MKNNILVNLLNKLRDFFSKRKKINLGDENLKVHNFQLQGTLTKFSFLIDKKYFYLSPENIFVREKIFSEFLFSHQRKYNYPNLEDFQKYWCQETKKNKSIKCDLEDIIIILNFFKNMAPPKAIVMMETHFLLYTPIHIIREALQHVCDNNNIPVDTMRLRKYEEDWYKNKIIFSWREKDKEYIIGEENLVSQVTEFSTSRIKYENVFLAIVLSKLESHCKKPPQEKPIITFHELFMYYRDLLSDFGCISKIPLSNRNHQYKHILYTMFGDRKTYFTLLNSCDLVEIQLYIRIINLITKNSGIFPQRLYLRSIAFRNNLSLSGQYDLTNKKSLFLMLTHLRNQFIEFFILNIEDIKNGKDKS